MYSLRVLDGLHMFLLLPDDLIFPACYTVQFGPNTTGDTISISVTLLLTFFLKQSSAFLLLLQFQAFVTVLKTVIGGFGYLQVCAVHIHCIGI